MSIRFYTYLPLTDWLKIYCSSFTHKYIWIKFIQHFYSYLINFGCLYGLSAFHIVAPLSQWSVNRRKFSRILSNKITPSCNLHCVSWKPMTILRQLSGQVCFKSCQEEFQNLLYWGYWVSISTKLGWNWKQQKKRVLSERVNFSDKKNKSTVRFQILPAN